MPNRNEGISSLNSRPFGLKAKYVANLNAVKIRIKITSRLITHIMVFGILSLINMQKPQKKRISGL